MEWKAKILIPQWKEVSQDELVKEQPHTNGVEYFFLYMGKQEQVFHTYLPYARVMILENWEQIQQINQLLNEESGLKEIWIIDLFVCDIGDSAAIYTKAYLFLELIKKIYVYQHIRIKVIVKNGLTLHEFDPSISPQNAVLLGMAQTATQEFIHLKMVALSINNVIGENIEWIKRENKDNNLSGRPILLTNGKRYLREVVETQLPSKQISRFRYKGTYMVIGGTGGLGNVLCKYLIQNYDARLIVVGRKAEGGKVLDELKEVGGSVVYEQVDLLDSEKLDHLIARYPVVHGIVHSALELRDRFIPFMDQKTLYDVLDPKVKGSIHLLKALVKYNVNLDFILFFSSILSFVSISGQANYAAGCMFKDAMAFLLRNFYMYETKIINWGYWGKVGVVATETYRERMRHFGIGSIEPEEGMKIVEDFLASDLTQIGVFKATAHTFNRFHIQIKDETEDLIKENANHPTDLNNKILDEDTDIAFLQKIVPLYHSSNEVVLYTRQAYRVLERYARHRIRQVELPETVLDKYAQLKAAIAHMPLDDPIRREQIIENFPGLQPFIDLLDHCLYYYPDILTGKVDCIRVLFPNGKFDLVEPIYRDNLFADYFNGVVRDIVRNYLAQNTHNDTINIIEIGAGTGGTTKYILPILSDKVKYYFTDVSFSFLHKAKAEFAEYHNIYYDIYDIEKPSGEAFKNNFNIVIATNVLHVTRNISHTLLNVRNLLKKGGIIILNELVAREDFSTLVFGLTPGFWRFEDNRIADSPFLTSAEWQTLLLRSGLKHVLFYGDTPQQIIVAASEGVGAVFSTFSSNPSLDIDVGRITAFSSNPSLDAEEFLHKYPSLEDRVQKFIMDTIARIMKIPVSEIKLDTVFTNYGIGSLIIVELLKPFRCKFGSLATTLLFEYPTIRTLATYFLENHREKVEQIFKKRDNEPALSQKERGGALKNVPRSSADPSNTCSENDIAVIGMAGLFPQIENCQELWDNIHHWHSCIEPIPVKGWNVEQLYDTQDQCILNKKKSPYGGFIQNAIYFDHEFFKITSYEAKNIDLQEQLCMQAAYHAVEDSGLPTSKLMGKEVGVFVGVPNGGYIGMGRDRFSTNGIDASYCSIANRLSYAFGWLGPSIVLDSGCSSSLTALHMACQSLRAEECSISIVGGANPMVYPSQCIPLGKNDGFIKGGGVIALVVKKYRKAIQDKDRIYGIIKASSVNSGVSFRGDTLPEGNAQTKLIQAMLKKADIPIESISYVETHSIEIEEGGLKELTALTKVFNHLGKSFCPIGSIKNNTDYFGSAAGFAGLVKVFLQMKHQTLVPSLPPEEINPYLTIYNTPFYMVRSTQNWAKPVNFPRRALVTSFGRGGSNASLIVEEQESIPDDSSQYALEYFIIPISARSVYSLQRQLDQLRIWIKKYPHQDLYPIAYTLACGRDHYSHRICFVVRSIEELKELLCQTVLELTNTIKLDSALQRKDIKCDYAYLLTLSKEAIQAAFIQISQAYQSGLFIPWENVYGVRKIISLPYYCFDQNIYDGGESAQYGLFNEEQYLNHHQINHVPIVPAALSLARIVRKLDYTVSSLQNVYWLKPMKSFKGIEEIVTDRMFYLQDAQGVSYVKGEMGKEISPFYPEVLNNCLKESSPFDMLESKEIYMYYNEMGFQYGTTYQRLSSIKRFNRMAIGTIHSLEDPNFRLHPSMIDAGFQITAPLLEIQGLLESDEISLPFYLKKMNIYKLPLDKLAYCYCMVHNISDNKKEVSYNLYFMDVHNEVMLSLEEMCFRKVNKERFYHKNLFYSADNSEPDAPSFKVYKLKNK